MRYQIKKSLRHYHLKTYLHDEYMPVDSIDCSLGVNPFGFSPSITKQVLSHMVDAIGAYPSYPYRHLKDAIINYFSPAAKIAPEQIQIHAGSMPAMMNIHRLLVTENTRVLALAPTFCSATTDMVAMGATLDSVYLKSKKRYAITLEDILSALTPEHAIVYIDNPNNPTGQMINIADLARLATTLEKQHAMLIVDEAYGEFMPHANSAATLLKDHPNVLVTRSFSKGFGMAGIRAGYLLAPIPFVPYLNKLPAEMALSELSARLCPYALKDIEHIEYSKKHIAHNKKIFIDHLNILKVAETADETPILMLYTEKDVNLHALLKDVGILTESGADYDGIDHRHVRLRMPAAVDALLFRIKKAEAHLQYF